MTLYTHINNIRIVTRSITFCYFSCYSLCCCGHFVLNVIDLNIDQFKHSTAIAIKCIHWFISIGDARIDSISLSTFNQFMQYQWNVDVYLTNLILTSSYPSTIKKSLPKKNPIESLSTHDHNRMLMNVIILLLKCCWAHTVMDCV